jgi:hypothetical protein
MDIVVDHCGFFQNETVQDLAGNGAARFGSSDGVSLPLQLIVRNSEFAQNVAKDDGAGICLNFGGANRLVAEVANNVFHDNYCQGAWAPNSPGVAWLDGTRVYNNVFYSVPPISVDTDGDGLSDGDEYIAGTSLTNARSVFALGNPMHLSGTYSETLAWDTTNHVWATQTLFAAEGLVFQWPTMTGRVYRFFSTTNLIVGTSSWNCIAGPITGDGSVVSYTNSITNTVQGFYRLKVEMP